jgi:hypothetical protein
MRARLPFRIDAEQIEEDRAFWEFSVNRVPFATSHPHQMSHLNSIHKNLLFNAVMGVKGSRMASIWHSRASYVRNLGIAPR